MLLLFFDWQFLPIYVSIMKSKKQNWVWFVLRNYIVRLSKAELTPQPSKHIISCSSSAKWDS
jgi:hypothetical protein